MQDDLFDVVRSEAAFNQRCANVQAKLIPLPERDHSANDQDSPRALVEMRPGPDLAPGIARDQVLEIGVESVAFLDRLVDPGVAQDLSAFCHAAVVTLLVVHGYLLVDNFRIASPCSQ